MKKLVLLFVLAFTMVVSAQELEERNGHYVKEVYSEVISGTLVLHPIVYVYFEKDMVDKYGWSEHKLTTMALSSIILAKIDVEDIDSYIFTDDFVLIADINGEIMTSVNGRALNPYGRFENVNTTIYFDKNGNVEKDNIGLFRIITK